MSQDSPSETKPANTPSRTLLTTHLVSICAVGLLICFFLPWSNVILGNLSGFRLVAEGGGKFVLLWSIPIFSALTIFAGITQRHQRIAALLTGALPLCVLAYSLHQIGSELLQFLGLGAWLSLVFGLALLILPHRLKRKSQGYDK